VSARTDLTVGQLAVGWRVDAALDDAGRSRVDELSAGLAGPALEDALDGVPGHLRAEVCVRRVVVPAVRVRWEADDTDLVAAVAGAIGRAVAGAAGRAGGAAGPAGTEVVRYPARAAARTDLVLSVLAGNREREWAWRLLGLWPAGEWPAAEAVSRTVGDAVAAEPSALVGLAVAAARAGVLGGLVGCLGPAGLAAAARRAWHAAGGAEPVAAVDPASAAAVAAVRLAAVVRRRSTIVAAAGSARGATVPELATALATLAVLEVEPALAAAPAGRAAVLLLAPTPVEAASPRRPSAVDIRPVPDLVAGPDPGAAPGPPPGSAVDPRAVRGGRPDVVADPAVSEVDGGRAEPGGSDSSGSAVAPSTTAWGGLLFLVPLVGRLGIPDAVVAGPGAYALRPVLHALARRLTAAAVPDAPPVDDRDPALLAFCGLPPNADPPDPPNPADPADVTAAAAGDAVGGYAEAVVAELAELDETLTLRSVCRRHAVIEADPGWIDVELQLDQVDVAVRRAGLDLDPGWVPWLGCVLRFRYV
jgi:hypothetical protein